MARPPISDHVSTATGNGNVHTSIEVIKERMLGNDKALLIQAAEYERRLDSLNHKAEEAARIQQTYLPREVFDGNNKAVTERLQKFFEILDTRIKLMEARWDRVSGGTKTAEIAIRVVWGLVGGVVISGMMYVLAQVAK